jgi:Mg2+/Co2+ transporter CorB
MTEQISEILTTPTLLVLLVILILVSAFFSASETALMAINRYRLKHASKTSATARLVTQLLMRPDRLLTVVLIGNSFANIAAASIATIVGVRLFGEIGALYATGLVAVIVLLFAEITPKIIASQKPELISYLAVRPLFLTIKALFPLVWVANILSNGLLFLMGVKHYKKTLDILTMDELRTMVNEAGALIPTQHKSMLTSILDLDNITVEDIMITRSEIVGIDLNDDDKTLLEKIRGSQHTLLPIYRDDIDDIYGVIHMRDLTHYLTDHVFSKPMLLELAEKPYFVPEGTHLHTQLFNFQRTKNRFGLVVDEYGDILGLVTLADILEEIVGEFTTDVQDTQRITPQPDGTYLVDGTINIRYINQTMKWELPITNAKTLSGAIIEYLELIPTANTCVLLNNYPIEIILVQDNIVKSCKIGKKLHYSRHN